MITSSFKLRRDFKDYLFRRIFLDENNVIILIYALLDTVLTPPFQLKYINLDDNIFTRLRNDISVLVNNDFLVLLIPNNHA